MRNKLNTDRKDGETEHMKIVIVDEDNKVIGSKEREEVQPEDIYRVSGLWITNSRGDVLLAQRSFSKSHDPGKWGPAVAGTVEEGESYEENVVKEAFEELGLRDIKPEAGPIRRNRGIHNYFSKRFYLLVNRGVDEFVIAKNEVKQIKWFNPQRLRGLIKEKPEMFIESLQSWIDEL